MPRRAITGPRTFVVMALGVLFAISGVIVDLVAARAAGSSDEDPAPGDTALRSIIDRFEPATASGWAAGLGAIVGHVTAHVSGPAVSVSEAEPEPFMTTIRLRPRPRPGPFSMNLYQPGDFVSQATHWWCVPAATATMMNIMRVGPRRGSERFQLWLHREADRIDPDPDEERDDEPRRLDGMGLTDWKRLLIRNSYGKYMVTAVPTLQGAIRKAARAMRVTGRPVGLVVWRGAHAWVMSGFTATADPAHTSGFQVRSVHPGRLVPARQLDLGPLTPAQRRGAGRGPVGRLPAL